MISQKEKIGGLLKKIAARIRRKIIFYTENINTKTILRKDEVKMETLVLNTFFFFVLNLETIVPNAHKYSKITQKNHRFRQMFWSSSFCFEKIAWQSWSQLNWSTQKFLIHWISYLIPKEQLIDEDLLTSNFSKCWPILTFSLNFYHLIFQIDDLVFRIDNIPSLFHSFNYSFQFLSKGFDLIYKSKSQRTCSVYHWDIEMCCVKWFGWCVLMCVERCISQIQKCLSQFAVFVLIFFIICFYSL